MIHVIDQVLPDPVAYRAQALAQPFGLVHLGQTFSGIAAAPDRTLEEWFERTFPGIVSTTTFFRRSPHRQAEPNYIHNDVDMGDLTGILYLNPAPQKGDGTKFWRNPHTGFEESREPMADQDHRLAEQALECWRTVDAVFNRCVVFDATHLHSRAIRENYGDGDTARLIQVVFGRWKETRA